MTQLKAGSQIDYRVSGVVFLRGTVTDIDPINKKVWVRPDSNPAAEPIMIPFDKVKIPLDTVLEDVKVRKDQDITINYQDVTTEDEDQDLGFEDD